MVDLSGRLGKVDKGGGRGAGAGAGKEGLTSCCTGCSGGRCSCWTWALWASRCLLLPIRDSLPLSLPPPPSSPLAPASWASLGWGLLLRWDLLLRESLPNRLVPRLDSSLTVEPTPTLRNKDTENEKSRGDARCTTADEVQRLPVLCLQTKTSVTSCATSPSRCLRNTTLSATSKLEKSSMVSHALHLWMLRVQFANHIYVCFSLHCIVMK